MDTVDYNYKKWQVSHSISWDGDLDDFFMKVTRPGPGTWRIEGGQLILEGRGWNWAKWADALGNPTNWKM